jgi:hypothetical protein
MEQIVASDHARSSGIKTSVPPGWLDLTAMKVYRIIRISYATADQRDASTPDLNLPPVVLMVRTSLRVAPRSGPDFICTSMRWACRSCAIWRSPAGHLLRQRARNLGLDDRQFTFIIRPRKCAFRELDRTGSRWPVGHCVPRKLGLGSPRKDVGRLTPAVSAPRKYPPSKARRAWVAPLASRVIPVFRIEEEQEQSWSTAILAPRPHLDPDLEARCSKCLQPFVQRGLALGDVGAAFLAT